MWIPIVSGIFALAGGFIGACMHHRTQHQIWLFQRRTEVFREFLLTLDKCRENAGKFFRKSPEGNIEAELIDIYEPAFAHAKIVRLLVNNSDKEEVEKIVMKIYALHATPHLGDSRFKDIVNRREELQSILEKHLRKPKWYEMV